MKKQLQTIILLGAISVSSMNAQTWSAVGTGVRGTAANVASMGVFGGELYVGGGFDTAGSVESFNLAKWNGTTWSVGNSGLTISTAFGVSAMTNFNTQLIAGGTSFASGASQDVATWNGTTWGPLTTGIYGSGYLNCLAVFNGELYVGGSFVKAGGVTASNIAKWNGSSWSAVGTGTNGEVFALGVCNNALYIGGSFTSAGGTASPCIAKWNGTSYSAMSTGATGGNVYAFATIGTDLYVGGDFTSIGTIGTPKGVVKWNGSAFSALGSGVIGSLNVGTVFALTVYNGNLIAGGSFSSSGLSSFDGVAKWNGSTWLALGSGDDASGSVRALCVYNSSLYMGGDFISAGGNSVNHIAKWTEPNGVTENYFESGITIYPNPFSSETTIEFNELQKNTTVKLIDIVGKEIKTVVLKDENKLTIEKGNLKAGIYFLEMKDENYNTVNKKIVIQQREKMKKTITILAMTLLSINTFAQAPNWQWAKSAGGSYYDYGVGIVEDGAGNSYVTGNFGSPSITFGSTTLTNADNTGNTSDMYIVKYDAGGNVVWAKGAGEVLLIMVSVSLWMQVVIVMLPGNSKVHPLPLEAPL